MERIIEMVLTGFGMGETIDTICETAHRVYDGEFGAELVEHAINMAINERNKPMTSEEIVGYILTREAEGIHDDVIDQELTQMGCTEEQIDDANDLYALKWKPLQ